MLSTSLGKWLVRSAQRILLTLSYLRYRGVGKTISWVVGPEEIATMVKNIADALPGSHTAVLSANRFYDFRYDSTVSGDGGGAFSVIRRLVAAPWLLGKLARQAEGFIYVGATGFLVETGDQREYEFAFLTRRGIRIVCYFTGNDIRSPRLMLAMQGETGEENLATYLSQVNPVFATDAYDNTKRRIAEVAQKHAHVIFNSRVDQLSYLTVPTEPFRYFYPDDASFTSLDKFAEVTRLVIVHAPSSPVIKGTQIVRAAVRRLRDLGYAFDYVELIERPHSEVLAELSRAHIALNEFYAFVPGVFGVEAMAAGCALVTGADERVETDLPPGSNEAWLVTRGYEIFDNLKRLLDHPDELAPLAAAGQQWVRENALASRSGEALRKALARR